MGKPGTQVAGKPKFSFSNFSSLFLTLSTVSGSPRSKSAYCDSVENKYFLIIVYGKSLNEEETC